MNSLEIKKLQYFFSRLNSDMVQHFGQLSLIGVNVLTVALAALIFYSISTWFEVFVQWTNLKDGESKDNFDASLKLAVRWTCCVIFILIVVSLILGASPTSKDLPEWGGHETVEMPTTMMI